MVPDDDSAPRLSEIEKAEIKETFNSLVHSHGTDAALEKVLKDATRILQLQWHSTNPAFAENHPSESDTGVSDLGASEAAIEEEASKSTVSRSITSLADLSESLGDLDARITRLRRAYRVHDERLRTLHRQELQSLASSMSAITHSLAKLIQKYQYNISMRRNHLWAQLTLLDGVEFRTSLPEEVMKPLREDCLTRIGHTVSKEPFVTPAAKIKSEQGQINTMLILLDRAFHVPRGSRKGANISKRALFDSSRLLYLSGMSPDITIARLPSPGHDFLAQGINHHVQNISASEAESIVELKKRELLGRDIAQGLDYLLALLAHQPEKRRFISLITTMSQHVILVLERSIYDPEQRQPIDCEALNTLMNAAMMNAGNLLSPTEKPSDNAKAVHDSVKDPSPSKTAGRLKLKGKKKKKAAGGESEAEKNVSLNGESSSQQVDCEIADPHLNKEDSKEIDDTPSSSEVEEIGPGKELPISPIRPTFAVKIYQPTSLVDATTMYNWFLDIPQNLSISEAIEEKLKAEEVPPPPEEPPSPPAPPPPAPRAPPPPIQEDQPIQNSLWSWVFRARRPSVTPLSSPGAQQRAFHVAANLRACPTFQRSTAMLKPLKTLAIPGSRRMSTALITLPSLGHALCRCVSHHQAATRVS